MIGGTVLDEAGGTERSAEASWPPFSNRSAGLGDSAREMTASNSAEAPCARLRIRGAIPDYRWLAIAAEVAPANGSRPATISYSVIPSE